MPKSKRRKISNFQRIQSRNRKARLYARMEERARLKEEAKASQPQPEPEAPEVCAAN
jgi:hypothetical protein